MIRLHYSNRTEALLGALVRTIDGRPDPLAPIDVVVPNRNMERYLELGIAQALGVAANLRFHRLERFVRDWLEQALPDTRIFDREAFETAVLAALLDDEVLAHPDLDRVSAYLHAAGHEPQAVDLRRVQLAARVGGLFEEYSFSRPALLDAWSDNRAGLERAGLERAGLERAGLEREGTRETEAWQRRVWSHARRGAGPSWKTFHEALRAADRSAEMAPRNARHDEPPHIHVFGVSYVARIFQWAFAVLGGRLELHLYALNPCMEFWEDVPSASELKPRARLGHRSHRLGEEALGTHERHPGLGDDPRDTPALVLWGRPGREHVHLLNDLTGCDFEPVFEDPIRAVGQPTLLARLQRDTLLREPERTEPLEDPVLPEDRSIELLAAPGVRREVEAVADRIWALVREDDETGDGPGELPPLRFHDIAVLVAGPERESYLPHIQAVFTEAWRIPHNVVDLPLAASSRVVEAALLLLDLPFTRFSRPDVLDVVTHPAVRGRIPDLDPNDWITLCDRLGVFHGIDHDEHAATYIERDLINWDQAVRRIALGAVMTGEASGDERAFVLDGEDYLPEEGDEQAAAELGLVVRSLAHDVRFARREHLALGEWAEFLAGLFQGYLVPSSPAEEADLRRCLAAAQAIGERSLDRPVSYRVAAELARRSLGGLSGGRGEYLVDGVVVSGLVPMRTIPFRVVFVLGLGEGRFPVPERRDALDLRSAARRLGDVSPAERDEYTFLEALLCARERLVLSYVARDELTGDERAPSTVVRQLLDVVERGYLPGTEGSLLHRAPLRRYDPAVIAPGAAVPTVLAEARAEARAKALGEDWRRIRPVRGPRPPPADALAEVRAAAGENWDALARLLRACPVPAGNRPRVDPAPDEGEPVETLRLSLSNLRKFLETPLQGWARAVLGIEEEDDEPAEAREDEPFDADALHQTVALREVFLEAAREGRPEEEAYRDTVRRLAARGRWPVGRLAELRAARDAAVLEAWRRQLAALCSGEPGRPLLLRFGPGTEHGEADAWLDAIVVEMDDPRPDRPGTRLRVELTGRTQPLLEVPRGSLILAPRAPARPEVRLRHVLRAFVDHAALSASGAWPDATHGAFVLYGQTDAAVPPTPLAPLSRAAAHDWLAGLLRDLLGRAHAYLLPCDAVLPFVDRWDTCTGADLVDAVERLRRDRMAPGGQARFGPVPSPERYAPPPEEEALSMARRRFGLLVETLGGNAP